MNIKEAKQRLNRIIEHEFFTEENYKNGMWLQQARRLIAMIYKQ